jgi:pimeloyl-ACP methyl ester carboxylesterase
MEEKIFSHTKGPIPYLEGGEGDNLLFLHGAFAMPHAYTPLLTLLSEHFHVIAPTHPGHGKAFGISAQFSFSDFIQTYEEFLHGIAFKPSVVVGHSFGGAIAFEIGAHYPEIKIIVLDAVGLPFPLHVKDFIKAIIIEGENALKNNPDMEMVKELVSAAKSLTLTVTIHPENIPWFYQYGSTLDLTDVLQKLTNSVAILWGEKDKLVPLDVGKRIHECISQSTLTTYTEYEHDYCVIHPEFTHDEIIQALTLMEK